MKILRALIYWLVLIAFMPIIAAIWIGYLLFIMVTVRNLKESVKLWVMTIKQQNSIDSDFINNGFAK